MPLSKSARRREEIIHCATKLFDEKGYFNTSLDDIAQEVGIKREALYYYFKNRTELLLVIIEPQAIALIKGMQDVMDSGMPATDKLRAAIANHLERFDHHYPEMTIALRDGIMEVGDPVRVPMTRFWETYENLWTRLISEGQATGLFRSIGEPKMIAFGILGMCNGLSRWYKPNRPAATEELTETYFAMVSEGLMAG